MLALITCLYFAPCHANCTADSEVAVRFMNDYVAYRIAVDHLRREPSVEIWLKAGKLVSPDFLKAYRRDLEEGHKIDRNLGRGSDLILDAQDYPEKGFALLRCSMTNGYVELRGIDWPEFTVTVKTVRIGATLRVDGAGVVNIPPAERANR